MSSKALARDYLEGTTCSGCAFGANCIRGQEQETYAGVEGTVCEGWGLPGAIFTQKTVEIAAPLAGPWDCARDDRLDHVDQAVPVFRVMQLDPSICPPGTAGNLRTDCQWKIATTGS